MYSLFACRTIDRQMKVFELLSFNRELLRRIHTAGIKPEDYKYVPLYEEFERMKANGDKVTYIVTVLSAKYEISERQVYNLLGRFGQEINCTSHAVE